MNTKGEWMTLRLTAGFILPEFICQLARPVVELQSDGEAHLKVCRFVLHTEMPNTIRGFLADFAAEWPAIFLYEETAVHQARMRQAGMDPTLTAAGNSVFPPALRPEVA